MRMIIALAAISTALAAAPAAAKPGFSEGIGLFPARSGFARTQTGKPVKAASVTEADCNDSAKAKTLSVLQQRECLMLTRKWPNKK